jgi:hypothetical protein
MFWRRNGTSPEPPTLKKAEDGHARWERWHKRRLEEEARVRPILDKHFELSQFIEKRYKDRDKDPDALPEVIDACEQMIIIAPQVAQAMKVMYGQPIMNFDGVFEAPVSDTVVPPGHEGYQRLITIRKQQGNQEEAGLLAKEFEGVWRC